MSAAGTVLLVEQSLNGLQFGIMLFLMAAGLTLVFGVMNVVNLAHGSLYMVGAYLCASVFSASGSFLLGVAAGIAGATLVGILFEVTVFRRIYDGDHLDHVLATFGLTLICNEVVRMIWGPTALFAAVPRLLAGQVQLLPGFSYPTYRFAIIIVGLIVAGLLYILVNRTRLGMVIRASASNRIMAAALGVNDVVLYTIVFGLVAAPIFAVTPGMGDNVLILSFVVVVIGGIGSVRGAFLAALLIGFVDTFGRAFLRPVLASLFTGSVADNAAPAIASLLIYALMAVVLFFRPQGLFPPRTR
jgi:branched-chain amino acid transport system permease protein